MTHPWLGGTGTITKKMQDRRMPSDLAKSAIPLTIVCGPPGSGKSTYVREHARNGDVIICLDTIMQKISGQPEHQTPAWCLPQALDTRNAMLRSLSSAEKHSEGARAWFIVAAPSPRDREKWAARLGGRLQVMDTPSAECVRRIKADASRAGHEERMIQSALAWWRANPHLVRKISLRADHVKPRVPHNFELVRNRDGAENGDSDG
jgi:5-methylcytosine-specific restriction protein A